MLTLIDKLTLENYKQFAGINEIEFSTDLKQHITVIHGTNGAGKTNLLRATRWCITGKAVQPATQRDQSIMLCWQVANDCGGKSLSIGVGMKVRQGAKKFVIQRRTSYKKVRKHFLEERNKENLTVSRSHKNNPTDLHGLQRESRLNRELLIMSNYFRRWLEDCQYNLPRTSGVTRAAILELIQYRDLPSKLPIIAKESTMLFRTIVGKSSHYHSTTIKITSDCDLELIKLGQNIVSSLAVEELVALSFALLLTVLKVSGKRFPIFLDSPFARLSKYKNSIARVLANLDQQVIILAHETELYGTSSLSPRIGKEYVIQMEMEKGTSRIMPEELMVH